jgi:hypothetical protein
MSSIRTHTKPNFPNREDVRKDLERKSIEKKINNKKDATNRFISFMESIKANMNGIWDGGRLPSGNFILTQNSIIFNENMNDVDDHAISEYADDLNEQDWVTSKNSNSFTIYHPSVQKEKSCPVVVPSSHPPPPEDPLPTEDEAANNFRDWLRKQIQTDSLFWSCLGSKRDFLNRSYPASRGLGVLEINRIFSRIFSTKNSQSTSFVIPSSRIMVQNFNTYYGENITWNY